MAQRHIEGLIDRLRAENERLQKRVNYLEIQFSRSGYEQTLLDAERYRWLRGKQLVGNQPGSWKTISDGVIDNLRGEEN